MDFRENYDKVLLNMARVAELSPIIYSYLKNIQKNAYNTNRHKIESQRTIKKFKS